MNHFCKHASQLTSDLSERPLSLKERFSLRLHLFMCSVCREDVQNTRLLSRLFEKIRSDHASDAHLCLPKDKRQRIHQHLSQPSDQKNV